MTLTLVVLLAIPIMGQFTACCGVVRGAIAIRVSAQRIAAGRLQSLLASTLVSVAPAHSLNFFSFSSPHHILKMDFSTVHEQGSLKAENGMRVENQASASKHT